MTASSSLLCYPHMSLSTLVLCPSRVDSIRAAGVRRFNRQLMCLVHINQRASAGGHLASRSPTPKAVRIHVGFFSEKIKIAMQK